MMSRIMGLEYEEIATELGRSAAAVRGLVARGLAALAGRSMVGESDAALAARLVLAPRATRLPLPADEEPADTETQEPETTDDDGEPIEWLVPSEHLDNLMPL